MTIPDRDLERTFKAPPLALLDGCRRVLDLGCGTGVSLELLAGRGTPGLGVDVEGRALREAREHGLTVEEGDILEFLESVEPGRFDGVLVSHLVEHLDPGPLRRLLGRVRGILAPGGRVLLVTPDCRSLVTHLESFPVDETHVRLYHPRLLGRLLREAGFEVDVREGPRAGPLWGPEIAILHQLRRRWETEPPRPPPTVSPTRPVDWIKRSVARLLFRSVAPELRRARQELAVLAGHLARVLERVDLPAEAWVLGRVPAEAPAGDRDSGSSS